jgi:hypothetical protein
MTARAPLAVRDYCSFSFAERTVVTRVGPAAPPRSGADRDVIADPPTGLLRPGPGGQVVGALLGAAHLVAAEQHRDAEGQQQRGFMAAVTEDDA